MNPGKLDRRLTIQARTLTRDAAGGAVPSYADVDTVWAQKVETTGRESRIANQLRADTTIVFRIRYYADLTEQHRLLFEGRYYDVTQINEENRRETQLVQARTVEAAAA